MELNQTKRKERNEMKQGESLGFINCPSVNVCYQQTLSAKGQRETLSALPA